MPIMFKGALTGKLAPSITSIFYAVPFLIESHIKTCALIAKKCKSYLRIVSSVFGLV